MKRLEEKKSKCENYEKSNTILKEFSY